MGAAEHRAVEPGAGLERFRAVRRELEAAVLPLATSIDGRRFTFQASLHGLAFQPGGYVVLETEAGRKLGQVLDLSLARHDVGGVDLGVADGPSGVQAGLTISHAAGEGTIVEGAGAPFHDATARPATTAEVQAWTDRVAAASPAPLTIGELVLAPGVACRIDARGFNRHTFLFGQSGSGKTYSLGVLLERLLLDTDLRIVVLDPNSDFVRLPVVRADVDAPTAARYRAVAGSVAVHSARDTGPNRLRLRIAELDPEAQAALLRLDPVADRDEYAELAESLAAGRQPTAEALEQTGRVEAHRLAVRARNLGVERYRVWAREDPGSVLDAVTDPGTRCVVVDLGSLAGREEQSLVAGAVLTALWRDRERREPVLIVMDEAHNICPSRPPDALTGLATDAAARIAAEGRKFGLYLLVSTQRPQKVDENVLSQCDNVVLMRCNSRADAAFAQALLSFVPAGLIEQAVAFGLGEALVAGKISPWPALLRFGRRVSEEGGSDVPTTWATGPKVGGSPDSADATPPPGAGH